jgi:hypothetical protein
MSLDNEVIEPKKIIWPPSVEHDEQDKTAGGQSPEQPGEEATVVISAFLMYIDPSGHWAAEQDYTKKIIAQRAATFDDFYTAAVTLKKDIEVMEIANRTVGTQQQLAMQMQEQARMQQENLAIQARLKNGGRG